MGASRCPQGQARMRPQALRHTLDLVRRPPGHLPALPASAALHASPRPRPPAHAVLQRALSSAAAFGRVRAFRFKFKVITCVECNVRFRACSAARCVSSHRHAQHRQQGLLDAPDPGGPSWLGRATLFLQQTSPPCPGNPGRVRWHQPLDWVRQHRSSSCTGSVLFLSPALG